MKKIRFLLEYKCNPIWNYSETGELLNNGLPDELTSDLVLVNLFDEIQEEFDSLFENNAINFEYKGFSTDEDKIAFFNKIKKAIDLLYVKTKGIYKLQVDMNENDY